MIHDPVVNNSKQQVLCLRITAQGYINRLIARKIGEEFDPIEFIKRLMSDLDCQVKRWLKQYFWVLGFRVQPRFLESQHC